VHATDRAILGQVGKAWRALVASCTGPPRAGLKGGDLLKVKDFVGNTKLLAWAKKNGCNWEEKTCDEAANGGHLEVLQWARKHGCPWDGDRCARIAAMRGHLDMLKWVAQWHDCQLDVHTPAWAAAGGHLEMLQWSLENGCPCDERTCDAAAEHGHLECLKLAGEYDCPWGWTTIKHAREKWHVELTEDWDGDGWKFLSSMSDGPVTNVSEDTEEDDEEANVSEDSEADDDEDDEEDINFNDYMLMIDTLARYPGINAPRDLLQQFQLAQPVIGYNTPRRTVDGYALLLNHAKRHHGALQNMINMVRRNDSGPVVLGGQVI